MSPQRTSGAFGTTCSRRLRFPRPAPYTFTQPRVHYRSLPSRGAAAPPSGSVPKSYPIDPSDRQILKPKSVVRRFRAKTTSVTSNTTATVATRVGASTHSAKLQAVMADDSAADPALSPATSSPIQLAAQYYNDNLAPIVNPALRVAANGLTRGVKRAAEVAIIQPFKVAAEAYIETKHPAEDGLVIKRLKRLPRARNKTTTPAELENAIPADLLRRFRWATDPLQYLERRNHNRVRTFLSNIISHIESDNFSMFPDIDYILHPRALPASVQETLHKDCRPASLSTVLHNHMITYHKEHHYADRLTRFRASGWDLIDKFKALLEMHQVLYYNRGHIPTYEFYRLKPTGALADRFKELGFSGFDQRNHFMSCMKIIHYLLETRSEFNQTFPAETFAGILADLDAMRKDELPPSYVDWPGKYDLHKVGAFPDHDTEEKLFEIFKFADYKPDRMWEHWHPSPTKTKLNPAHYRTPVRKAMKKNEVVRDQQGQWRARKGALKNYETDYKSIEQRCENEITDEADKRLDIDIMDASVVKEGRATFIDSPLSWYMHPNNTPLQKSKDKLKAPMTPFPSKVDRAVAVKAAKQAEILPRAINPVLVVEPPRTIASTGSVAPAPIVNTDPAGDAISVTETRPAAAEYEGRISQDTVFAAAAEDRVPAVTGALTTTADTAHTVADDLPVAGDASVTNEEPTTEDEYEPVIEVKVVNSKYLSHRKDIWRQEKTMDELWDDGGPFGHLTDMLFQMDPAKRLDIELRTQLSDDAEFQRAQERRASIRRQEEAARQAKEAERKAKEEEARKVEEESQRLEKEARVAERNRHRQEDERVAQMGQLRRSHGPLVPDLPDKWVQKARATLRPQGPVELAKAADQTPLLLRDFSCLVPPNRWLNDTIVNSTLGHLVNFINTSEGLEDPPIQKRRCQLFNSYLCNNLFNEGRFPTGAMLRRLGMGSSDMFLDLETVLMPICKGFHWTLLVIRPKHRQIYHFDSLNANGSAAMKKQTLSWVRTLLGERFDETEWTMMKVPSPRQLNTDDCGVHTITNAICIGLGIDPSTAYESSKMTLQRLRLASILLIGGFRQEFSLEWL